MSNLLKSDSNPYNPPQAKPQKPPSETLTAAYRIARSAGTCMKTTHNTAIVAIPPEQVWEPIQAYGYSVSQRTTLPATKSAASCCTK